MLKIITGKVMTYEFLHDGSKFETTMHRHIYA